MEKKPTVSLQVYKGKELSYNKDGSVQNENHPVKIEHNTISWRNFMKYLRANGYVDVKVNSAYHVDADDKQTPYKDIDTIKKEVKEALSPTPIKVMTPEQKEIAELKAKVDALIGKSPKKTKKIKPVQEIDLKLKEVREEYYKAIGKKAYHAWDVKTLKQKIAKKK